MASYIIKKREPHSDKVSRSQIIYFMYTESNALRLLMRWQSCQRNTSHKSYQDYTKERKVCMSHTKVKERMIFFKGLCLCDYIIPRFF